jgi:hypothetical protein
MKITTSVWRPSLRRCGKRDSPIFVDTKIGTVPMIAAVLLICIFAPSFGDDLGQNNSQDETAVETRLRETVEYLASDELQGRAAGSEGIDKAADYIAKRMGKSGLKTDLYNGEPYQIFYGRLASNQDHIGLEQLNVFSTFGNTIYSIFAAIGNSSPNKRPERDSPIFDDTKIGIVPKKSPERPRANARGMVRMKNIVAILEAEGPKAEETIVIGAHYDHLGTRKTWDGKEEVYNGANDNASGVAVMLEMAEKLAHRNKKLPRRIVFVAFSGEESGLMGSFYYVHHPAVPLQKTIAMINLDVVGQMEDDLLVTVGTSTSPALAKMVEDIGKRRNLELMEMPSAFGGSDHLPFYSCRIPIVFFLSRGGWDRMHRPSDDANMLNYPGMRKIAQAATDLTIELAEADKRPEFSEENTSSVLLRSLVRLLGRIFN